MNITRMTGIKQDEDVATVGTPENPRELPAFPRVKTGRAAQRSLSDRFRYLQTHDGLDDPDVLLPVASRRDRRARDRAEQTERRKAQARYVRKELAKEREVPVSSTASQRRKFRRAGERLVAQAKRVGK